MIPPKVGYAHFCEHDRNMVEKKTKCDKCGKCYLFFKDTLEEDEDLIKAASAHAESEYKKAHPEVTKPVELAPTQHNTTLHYTTNTTQHYTTLHYTTLHYTTQLFL